MFVFRKGIGKLKHLSYYEKNQIIDNLPVNKGRKESIKEMIYLRIGE